MKRLSALFVLAAALMAALLVTSPAPQVAADADDRDYEVWALDQGTNKIHVFKPAGTPLGSDLELAATIDSEFEGQTLYKPHMILFGLHGLPGSKYGYVGNMGIDGPGNQSSASVINAETRTIVAKFDTGNRTHAVQPAPNGERALALVLGPAPCTTAPDCGRVAEILTDTAAGTFTLGRFYDYTDLALGSAEASLLPNFNPVCGSFTPDSTHFYVTFSSGGFVILRINEDPAQPLFSVVDVLDNGVGEGQIAPNGCGIGYSADGRLMFANSGATSVVDSDFYYVFDIETHELIKSVNVSNIVDDLHGMMLDPKGKDVIMAGRQSDNFIVIDQTTGELRANKTFSSGPADSPDLPDFSPDGKWVYTSLRGPCPATGAHALSGVTPGIAVVKLESRTVERVVPLPVAPAGPPCTLAGSSGTTDTRDPHGLAVRRLGGDVDDNEDQSSRQGGDRAAATFARLSGGAAVPVTLPAMAAAPIRASFTYQVADVNGRVRVALAPAPDPAADDAATAAALTCHIANERPEPMHIVVRQSDSQPEPLVANLGPPDEEGAT